MTAAIRFTNVVPPPPREGWPGPISFEIEEGSFTLFATAPAVAWALVRLIVGLREPAGGTVDVLGVHPGRLDRWATQRFRSRLGVGFEEPSGLVSNLPLRMNLVVPMLYSGLADMATAQERTETILRDLGLQRWAETRPADLPPEVRREAVMARAAVRDPELLVLEEPLTGLRPQRAKQVLTYCRKRARTIVMTTAEREGTQFEVADRVIFLDDAGIETQNHEVGVL